MIFSGLDYMGEKPFSDVLIHGLVRDAQGRKMSKSLGNGIDPLKVIEEHGADALRMSLATGNSPGNDMRFYSERVEAAGNFANKIWNAARFTHMNLKSDTLSFPDKNNLCLEDKWILSKYNKIVKEVTDNLDKFELGIAVSKVYDFIWDIICDWYIELIKPRFFETNKDENSRKAAENTLCYVLSNTLKLLHPFMPFITEEIWQSLPHEGESIMISKWPSYCEELSFEKEEATMETIMEAIKAIRNRRSEMNVAPSKKSKIYIKTDLKDAFEQGKAYIARLASGESIEICDDMNFDNMVAVISGGAEIYIPLGDLVNFEEEIERLNKEKERLLSEIDRVDKKLSNEKFVSKAPEKVVEEEKAKKIKYQSMLDNVIEALKKYAK